MFELDAPEPDRRAVEEWFEEWGGYVAGRKFEASRPLFDHRVLGFGTWMNTVEGLDRLEAEQWRSIWPAIRDFHHDTSTLRVGVSPDRLMAFGILAWTSTGFHEDGSEYDRPGRTTAVFIRSSIDQPWKAIHTHVSLFRGVPQKSYGEPG